MRSESIPSRSSSVAVTATTFVALVAMAATVSVAPQARAVTVDCRAVVSEGPAVRSVAAAVAAVARDLLKNDRAEVALPAPMLVATSLPPIGGKPLVPTAGRQPCGIELREALLALPPPRG